MDSRFCVGCAAPQRSVERRHATIIEVCSTQSDLGRPGTARFAASKGAVNRLTQGMAIDLGSYGVRVNGLEPVHFKPELNDAPVSTRRSPLGSPTAHQPAAGARWAGGAVRRCSACPKRRAS